eukprot:scaffold82347_cov46-Attheya_sp.AAC.1
MVDESTITATSFLLKKLGVTTGSWYPYTNVSLSVAGRMPESDRELSIRFRSNFTRSSEGGGPENFRTAK